MKYLARNQQRGFTLLEVIVALTITGFVLGGLFTLLGSSKQLSWRSEDSLLRAVKLRAMINFAMLEDEFSEVEPILENDRYGSSAGEIIEAPERKTQAIVFTLQEFEIIDQETETSIPGTRWLRLELAQ
ncbi:MAG: prepilin-type N-terminal cleavage/methylation domain-containing protein [Pseudohongiellaceae bacterium]